MLKGERYCLNCKKVLPVHLTNNETFKCPHCNSVEHDFGLRPFVKDIVCPECRGMLEDTNTTSLHCLKCNISWRV